jgi:hypothetical protein
MEVAEGHGVGGGTVKNGRMNEGGQKRAWLHTIPFCSSYHFQ